MTKKNTYTGEFYQRDRYMHPPAYAEIYKTSVPRRQSKRLFQSRIRCLKSRGQSLGTMIWANWTMI